uniref:Myb-like DNA-binding domain-containing protein n=1 Tax=Spironucleus salmonicida TaxID=348837 RepID=V6LWP8_9EUKA|eukprot:EST49010.1 Myb-like DNA-binding domain-containing protein [Spironucleus salmonicida]
MIPDYSDIKAPIWTKAEEQLLFDYVMAHGLAKGYVSWVNIKEVFPDRSLAQCTSKLLRMRQNPDRYNFRKAIRKARNREHPKQEISVGILQEILRSMQ